jgi:hypothetical protein
MSTTRSCSICGATGFNKGTHIEPTEDREKLFDEIARECELAQTQLTFGLHLHFRLFGSEDIDSDEHPSLVDNGFVVGPAIRLGASEHSSLSSRTDILALSDALAAAREMMAVRHHHELSALTHQRSELRSARKVVCRRLTRSGSEVVL